MFKICQGVRANQSCTAYLEHGGILGVKPILTFNVKKEIADLDAHTVWWAMEQHYALFSSVVMFTK